MMCEICGKAYAAPLTAALTAALERGVHRHQQCALKGLGLRVRVPAALGPCSSTMPLGLGLLSVSAPGAGLLPPAAPSALAGQKLCDEAESNGVAEGFCASGA